MPPENMSEIWLKYASLLWGYILDGFVLFLWWQESLLPGFAMQTPFYKNVVFGMASKHLHSPSMELLLGSSHLVTQNGQGVKPYYIDLQWQPQSTQLLMGAFVFHFNRIEWAGMEKSVSILHPTPNLCLSKPFRKGGAGKKMSNSWNWPVEKTLTLLSKICSEVLILLCRYCDH